MRDGNRNGHKDPYELKLERQSEHQKGLHTGAVISKRLRIAQEQLSTSFGKAQRSIDEAVAVQRYLEGDHYKSATIADMSKDKRIPDKYNLVLRITNLLNGYFAKTVTDVVAQSVKFDEMANAVVHNENWKYTQRISEWPSLKEQIVSDLIEAGQGCVGIEVVDSGEFDELYRPIRRIEMNYIPFDRVFSDYTSLRKDRLDATYVNHIEYLSYETIRGRWGEEVADRVEALGGHEWDERINEDGTAEFDAWKDGREYAIVATHSKTPQGKVQTLYWFADFEIEHKLLPTTMFPVIAIPLKVSKLDDRYYTPLSQVLHTQDSINQALLKWQEMLDNKLIIADKKAVQTKDLPNLQRKARTVGEILHVDSIRGINVVNLTGEAQAHLNKLHTNIQFMLDTIGINEAFLGVSKAGDSGRKFEGQVAQSENTLNYIFTPINVMYKMSFYTTAHYSSLYKQATELLRFVDEFNKSRWQYINLPMMSIDPVTQEPYPMKSITHSEDGKTTVESGYINERALALRDIQMEVDVHTAPYDDTDAVESAFLESMLNGIGGQALMNAHPAGLFYVYQLLSKNLRTRNSEKIAKLFEMVNKQLGGLPIEDPRLYEQGGGQAQGQPQDGSANIVGTAGKQNDGQPAGYNKPTDGGEPNQGGQ